MSGEVLVGDVGGTHARFAVVDNTTGAIAHRSDIDLGEIDFSATLRRYLDDAGFATMPQAAAIAVAGPVANREVRLTNRSWRITEDELLGLGFARALLINDFAALAFAADRLGPDELHVIGADIPGASGTPITVLGAGTGFGVSCLARFGDRAIPMATEGGHAGFAPRGAAERAVLELLEARFGRVSIERILSGPGIVNLHAALAALNGRKAPELEAAEIVARRDADPDCSAAVDMFCAVYGSVAGDFALAHGARGGVFLAGGIAQKMETILETSTFRARFEDKGRLGAYVKEIPTKLIIGEDAAFRGAARALMPFGSAR